MKLFLDTANIAHIKSGVALGVVDGVTTNPSLIAKEGRDFKEVVKEIAEIVDGPISAEVTATDADGMIAQGQKLAEIHKNIVIKIPLTAEGLKAVKELSSKGIKINTTLCFSATQAWLAAKAGSTYISPFLGRLDDISQDGMSLVKDIRIIYDNYGFETEILAASIRHPEHVRIAALMGADIATIPYGVLEKLIKHPLTDIGLKKFLDDVAKANITV